MGDTIITITKGNAANKTLEYDLGDEANADPGDQVTWKIAPNSGVAAITAITPKPTSPDLFLGGEPAQLPNSTSWQGTVNPGITQESVEDYSITWTSVGGGWHGQNQGGIVTDPRLRVNPKKRK
jgi:hypothetical protein